MATTVGYTFTELTVSSESASSEFWGHTVSDLQTDIAIANGKMTGTLKYVSTGTLATDWGPGNFVALKFTNPDSSATSHLAGLKPSKGSGLVALDSDMNGVFKVTDNIAQNFISGSIAGNKTHLAVIDLSGLVCEGEEDDSK